MEFKGPMGAGAALIFGRRVKTLTFTRRVRAVPLRGLEDVAISCGRDENRGDETVRRESAARARAIMCACVAPRT